MKKRFPFHLKGIKRGQSFLELMLITLILALLLSGVVEFGFLMNNYLHVLDAAREAARYTSSGRPFTINADGTIYNLYDPAFYYVTALKAAQTLAPIRLHSAYPDDIVISVFSVGGPSPVRFPNPTYPSQSATDDLGWSLCAHYSDFLIYLNDPNGDGDTSDQIPIPDALSAPDWTSACTPHASAFSTSNIGTILNHTTQLPPVGVQAPPTGVLLVEIFYNYPQLLKLPVFTSVLPDPIPVYVYAIMPNSAAEPTPIP